MIEKMGKEKSSELPYHQQTIFGLTKEKMAYLVRPCATLVKTIQENLLVVSCDKS